MHRYRLALFCVLCLPFITIAQSPNILLIIADDLGVDMTNGYQQNAIMPFTPNLDALRDNGVTFMNTWANPQCTPTRAAIMSGKYGINTGVMRPPGNLDLEHQSIFNAIKEGSSTNYSSALIGKWHISNPADYDHPEQHGIEHYEGLFTSTVDDYYDWEKITNGEVSQVTEYATSHLTDASIDWISDQSSPWFLWLAHPAPHSPFHTPPSDLYQIDNTDSPFNKYIAAVEAMDAEIGRLIESISESDLENTIIIFIGDNGTPKSVIQSFPNNHAKSTLYEGGIRVPMFISGSPVQRKGEEEHGLTQVTDLYATILELSGAKLEGGIHNSLSLKPSLTCESGIQRIYNYTDYEDGNTLAWAIRTQDYKLIENEDGLQEFYDLSENILESENLIDALTEEQEDIRIMLEAEANTFRNGWSCNDGIKNGDESTIDDCMSACAEVDVLSTENIGCCDSPSQPNASYEFIENSKRNIYTNDYPNHDFCYNPNQIPDQKHYLFSIDEEPTIASTITEVVRENGRPARYFGVAKNGVIMAPAPAQPFIFENPSTGEFNWDWVFEPINNQGNGMELVALDCSSAHTGPQGYHYHGDMYEYMETEYPGITTSESIPDAPIQIGWAADGFPILYRFGPNENGNIEELQPSYQLKSGLRPGDGIQEPCGPYSGKYTKDYEYICGEGDLDECNGVARNIELATSSGTQTFDYFYVITAEFPQISRCLVGNVSADFDNGGDALTGTDADNDGFLSIYDCDDNNAQINPMAVEILGNDVDENCDGLLTSISDIDHMDISIGPNPSAGSIYIKNDHSVSLTADLFTVDGKHYTTTKGIQNISLHGLQAGIYFLKITKLGIVGPALKIIVQ